METRNGYYLSISEDAARTPELEEFLRWIATEAVEPPAFA
jgi:hypothetical protein